MLSKACTSCRIYGADGKPLCDAGVEQEGGRITLKLQGTGFKGARVVLPVDFFDNLKGRLRTYCELVIYRNPAYPQERAYWAAECRIVKVYDVIQRQLDTRVRVRFEEEFHSDQHGGFFGTIENLSAGGFFISTLQSLNKDERIRFRPRFLEQKWTLEAQVKWNQVKREGRFGYGCKFAPMVPEAEAKIRNLVFSRQLRGGK